MKTFKLNVDELYEIRKKAGFSLWLHTIQDKHDRYRTQYKLKKGKEDVTSVHHLIQKLLKGEDVFTHFLPKNEEAWLMAVLSEKKHIYYPYTKLVEACYRFIRMVPDGNKSKDDYPWLRIRAYIDSMRALDRPFVGSVSPDMLIALRPHVEKLRKELTTHIK